MGGASGGATPGDRFSDVVVEPDGSSCVAGWRTTPAGVESTTMRFAPEGTPDWVAVHGTGAAAAAALRRDGRGRIVTVAALGDDGLGAASHSLDGVLGWSSDLSANGRSAYVPCAAKAVPDKAFFTVGRADVAGGGTSAFIVRLQP